MDLQIGANIGDDSDLRAGEAEYTYSTMNSIELDRRFADEWWSTGSELFR